jgi:hypothetical protein
MPETMCYVVHSDIWNKKPPFNTITNALTRALQSVNKRKNNIQCYQLKFFQCSQHKQTLSRNFLMFPLFCPLPVYTNTHAHTQAVPEQHYYIAFPLFGAVIVFGLYVNVGGVKCEPTLAPSCPLLLKLPSCVTLFSFGGGGGEVSPGWYMMSVEHSVELERQGNPKYSEKTCPSATLSTTNPTWPDLGSNPGRHGGKLTTNRLSYGTASEWPIVYSWCYTPPLYCPVKQGSPSNVASG